MKYKCIECGKTVDAKDINEIMKKKKMCENCLEESKKIYKCKCYICGSNFNAKRENRKTCSDECYHIHLSNIQKKHYEEKVKGVKFKKQCSYCGCEFEGSLSTRYCSEKCRENNLFKKHLKEANEAIRIDKVKVYGANDGKMKSFINERSRKNI